MASGLVLTVLNYAAGVSNYFKRKRISVDDTDLLASKENKSRVELLPQEIILLVISYLPLESQACLATCSRTLAKKLGTQYWLAVRRERDASNGAFWRYLQLLQRDMPSFYCCYKCARLHSVDGNDHIPPEDEPKPPDHRIACLEDMTLWDKLRSSDLYLDLGREMSYTLYFHHIQQAIAHHRYYGTQRGRLGMLHFAIDQTHTSRLQNTEIFETEARIVSDHLLLRSQYLFQIDLNSRESVMKAAKTLCATLCPHFRWSFEAGSYREWDFWINCLVKCPNNHNICGVGGYCKNCHYDEHCPGCPTEASWQKEQIGYGLFIVAITQWKDLGTVLTPTDRVWRAHSARFETVALDDRYPEEFDNGGWSHGKFGLSEIRWRYEGQEGISIRELTAKNVDKIRACSKPQECEVGRSLPLDCPKAGNAARELNRL